MNKRLESLDALRGLDLFALVALDRILFKLQPAVNAAWFDTLLQGFTHKEWEGFSPWDLVMPLFMFMSGVTIPYSLARYREEGNLGAFYKRLARRIALLWLLGMACQGNLLALDPNHIYLFSNTLQAIAVGYLFSAILFVHTKLRTRLCITGALLALFWIAMAFMTIGGYGGGDYSPQGNLAEGIDRMVLGRFRDGASVEDGVVVFREWYTYTWLLSSLNFVVTVMSGVFAGELLRTELAGSRKAGFLVGFGLSLAVLGWALNPIHPVIKHIWTSSMVLVSSGYCLVLLGVFYWWIDVRDHKRGLTFLKVYGMNSITAYVVSNVVNFSGVSKSVLFGTEQYLGEWYAGLIALSNAAIVFGILYLMYRQKIFLRV